MSDDPNEFRVTDIRWVNDGPVPDGNEFLPVDTTPEPKMTFEIKSGTISFGGDSGIIAEVERSPPVVAIVDEFMSGAWLNLSPEQKQDFEAMKVAFKQFMAERVSQDSK